MLGVVVKIDVGDDPMPRYLKMTMHVEPPHNSPGFPAHGILPGLALAQMMKMWDLVLVLQDS